MFEKSVLGGTCVNWGCIPSKTMIHAALFKHEAHLGSEIGINSDDTHHTVDTESFFRHREAVVTRLRQERYLDVLKSMDGLELVKGPARFIDSHVVECNAVVTVRNDFL